MESAAACWGNKWPHYWSGGAEGGGGGDPGPSAVTPFAGCACLCEQLQRMTGIKDVPNNCQCVCVLTPLGNKTPAMTVHFLGGH